MKALILSAGFGTRLLPHTKKIPKPLFTIMSMPILEHTIKTLMGIGCEHIFINTHHLYEKIESFVKQLKYNVKIQTILEPDILDTGGAIANAKPFLKDSPFFVINSDIISTVDLGKVYAFHKRSNTLATLVLHDFKKFNKIGIDDQGYIQNFNSKTKPMAFTGIQVLSPRIYDYFPDKKVFSSIEVYQSLCHKNRVNAYVGKNIFWSDIGTKETYSLTSLQCLSADLFQINYDKIKNLQIDKLAGDGSDRLWYRVSYKKQSFVISDHGICLPKSVERLQLNAFIHIGNHLFSKKINVPRILNHDALSGMVILDDLGDVHLETIIKQQNNTQFTVKLYKKVVDSLIDFSFKGFQGFKKEWTCQTQRYSKTLILENECQYFWEAFVKKYLKIDTPFEDYLNEFDHIADLALKNGFIGLMHRDLQSRNIMIKNDRPFFIDFQSARQGPLQYDLASLLIDPYVHLKDHIRKDLLKYTTKKLNLDTIETTNFLESYHYCCLTRNLQILGAFSFLSLTKKKKQFEQYIPEAVYSLKNIIKNLDSKKLSKLSSFVQHL